MSQPTQVSQGAGRAEAGALVVVFAGAIAISFAPIFVRVSELPPTATALYRFVLAAPMLWAWLVWDSRRQNVRAKPPRKPQSLADFGLLGLAGLFFAADLGFWHWSIAYTSVANATLLANTAPVFVVLGGWIVFGRRVRTLFLLGMILAMAGTVVLMQSSTTAGSHNLVGDVLGIVTGLFYGSYLLTVERLRSTFTTATIMAYAIPVSAVVIFAVCLVLDEPLAATSLRGWAVLVGLALVSQVFGQSMIAYGLAHLPVAFTSVSLGAAIVLAGIAVARRGST